MYLVHRVRLSEIWTPGGVNHGLSAVVTPKCPVPSFIAPPPVNPPPCPRREVPQLDTVLGRLSQAVLQEGHCRKAWGFLGTGPGQSCCSQVSHAQPQPGKWALHSGNRPCRNLSPTPHAPCRGRVQEKGDRKWKPPGLGGASWAVLWANVCVADEGARDTGKRMIRGRNKQNHHKE